MLRRIGQSSTEAPDMAGHEAAFPVLDEAFTLDERPFGVRFYKSCTSFYHPYALLHAMRLEGEVLALSFATAEVSITARGLHALYVHLCQQRVAAVIEQGERYAGSSDAPVHISRIVETLK